MRSLLLLALVGCSRDDGLLRHNGSPEAQITSHQDGDVVTTGRPLTLQGTATDPDGDALAVRWLAGGTELCAAEGEAGTTTCEATLAAGQGRITLEVTDSDGAADAAHVDLALVDGDPPVITLVAPSDGEVVNEDEPIRFEAAVSDPDTELSELQNTWTSDVDGAIDGASPDSAGAIEFTATLSAGAHAVTAEVTDPDGLTARAVAAFTVNAVPSAPEVRILPDPATTSDDLAVVIDSDAVDPDGDTVTYAIEWRKDGVPTSTTTETLPASETRRGQVWTVAVVPHDAWGDGPAGTASLTIANSPPDAPTVTITPADPIEGEDALVCAVGTAAADADGDTVTYGLAWTVDGAAFPSTTTTSTTGDTVPASSTTAEEEWTCTVTPHDGTEQGTAGVASVSVLGVPVDYAHLQYPCSGSIARTTGTLDVYAWVYHPGVTDDYGEGAGIDADVGVGDDGTDPATDTSWTWTTASYNDDKPAYGDSSADPEPYSNDEYLGTLSAPSSTGSFDYAFRVTTDGGLSYTYVDLGGLACGGDGTIDGYDPADAGDLTVVP